MLLRVVLVCAAVGVVAVLRGAGTPAGPTAEDKTFLASLGTVQADETESDRIQVGHDMCHALRSGDSPGSLARYIGATGLAGGIQLAGFLSAATAPGSICPDQAASVAAWAGP